jgi:hypothetical protein
LNPHAPFRALAPQASASAYSATRTYARPRYLPCRRLTIANPAASGEAVARPPGQPKQRTPCRMPTPATATAIPLPALSAASMDAAPALATRLSQRHGCSADVFGGRPAPASRRVRCDHGVMTQTPAASGHHDTTAQDEVASLCSDLIRIDTTNRGDNAGPGERQAAEHVAALLAEVGLEPTVLESAARSARS